MAGNYIELSDEIKKSKGVMNIKNIDNKCVEYCLIAFRYQNQIKSKDTSNPNIYKNIFNLLKVQKIKNILLILKKICLNMKN
jgi:hypothetical protein